MIGCLIDSFYYTIFFFPWSCGCLWDNIYSWEFSDGFLSRPLKLAFELSFEYIGVMLTSAKLKFWLSLLLLLFSGGAWESWFELELLMIKSDFLIIWSMKVSTLSLSSFFSWLLLLLVLVCGVPETSSRLVFNLMFDFNSGKEMLYLSREWAFRVEVACG